VWPPEQADDYAGHTGYWAARAVRGLAFGLLFVPLTAPVSMPCSIGRQVREALTAPARLWRRRVSPGTVGERAPSAPRVAEPVAVPTAAAHRIIDAGARSPGSAVPAGLAEDRPRFLSRR
jgi:hypothetical protein